MKAGRIVALVFSCIFGLIGLVMLIGGIAAAIAVGVARDDDGFFRTDQFHIASPTAAITSESLDLGGAPGDAEWLTRRGDFATVSLQVESIGNGKELFAGIGPTADVDAYLASVARDRVDDFDDDARVPILIREEGAETPAPPGDEAFWAVQMTTTQSADLEWEVEDGDWTIVVMNADASPGIDADVRVGIKLDWLLPVAIGLTVVGLLLLAGGIVGAVLATRTPRAQPLPAAAGPGTPPPPMPTSAPPAAGAPPPPVPGATPPSTPGTPPPPVPDRPEPPPPSTGTQ
jgi:hypothetical protein